MNKLAIAVSAAALLLGSVALGMAADSDRGKSESAPGQQMLEKNGKGGPGGASGIAHERNEMRDRDDRGTMDRDRK
jgi:Spy/CpxP family protein refolding chaperone